MGENVKVESYAGYKAGETPRRVFMLGREYVVEYIIYRSKEFNLDTEDYTDTFKVKLKDYGECKLILRHDLDIWELEDIPKPEKAFSEEEFE